MCGSIASVGMRSATQVIGSVFSMYGQATHAISSTAHSMPIWVRVRDRSIIRWILGENRADIQNAQTRFSHGCLPGRSVLRPARPSGSSCDSTVPGKPHGIPADRVLLQIVAQSELGCTCPNTFCWVPSHSFSSLHNFRPRKSWFKSPANGP